MRGTPAQVRKYVPQIPADVDLTCYLEDANILIDTVCADAGYTADVLTRISVLLAAHNATLVYPLATTEKTGPFSDTYQRGSVGMGLKATPFGQQAMALDVKGCLAEAQGASEGKKVGLLWLGTEHD